jgi:hypothetical protein
MSTVNILVEEFETSEEWNWPVGWTIDSSNESSASYVTTFYKHTGSKGLAMWLYTLDSISDQYIRSSKDLDLTGVLNLNFWLNTEALPPSKLDETTLHVKVDGVTIYTDPGLASGGVWFKRKVSLAGLGYTGIHTVSFVLEYKV